jgi:hypothetical protein
MKTFTLLFLLFLSFQLSAQNTAEDSVLMNIRSFRFSISDALEPYSHSFLVSYEHQIGRHLSILAEAGPTIGSAWSEQVKLTRTHGHKMRFELRGYSKAKSSVRAYVGLQYMYKKLKGDDFEDSFSPRYDRTTSYGTRYKYDYLKTVTALHLTTGIMSIHFRKMVFDYGFFVGFRHKQIKAVGISDGLVLRHFYEYTPFQPFEEIPLDNIKINVGFVIRVGIAFNKISGAAFIGPYERF